VKSMNVVDSRTAEDEGLVSEIYDFTRFSMCHWALVTQGENGFGR
jgi:hypothetical protein